ncbi:MAG: YfhO family protein [Patescibacteria group bacterium]
MLKKFIASPFFAPATLVLIVIAVYHQFFIFGKIPFPGDLLVVSYSPWFDYYKFPVQNPLISDVFSQFFLWKYLSIDSLKNWQWPLWNPYSFTGTPLLATYHSASLYPLNILLLLPKYLGWGFFIFSQTLIGLIAMYLLLSLWVSSKLARLTGSMIFALGGLMTTWLELGTAVHAIIWLPFSIYSIELFWARFQFRYLLMLTGSQVFLVLAGNAQILTYSLIILTLYIFINCPYINIKKVSVRFFPPLIALVIGLLLTSIQLLPSLDLLSKSIRLTESYIGESNFGLLPINESIRFFVADFFGNPVTRNYWGFLNYSETSGFLGSLTLPILIFSFFYLKRSRLIIFFQILFALSILLLFNSPLSQMIYQTKIPLLTSSYASRILVIISFSVSILSAFSLNQLLITQNQENKFLKSTIWSWSIFVGILIGSFLSFFLSGFTVPFRNSILPVLLISLFLGLFMVMKKIRFKSYRVSKIHLILFILFIFLAFDLSRYFLKFNPFVSNNLIFPKVPAIEFLQKQPGLFRIGREHAETLPPNTWIAYNLYSYEGYDPIYLNQYGKFMHFLNGGDLRTGNSSRYAEIISNYSSPYLDAANSKFFIATLKDKNNDIPGKLLSKNVKDTNYNLIFQDGSAAILENPNALNRVYFAHSIITAPLQRIEDVIMGDKSFDPKVTIALTDDLNIKNPTGSGSAIITSYLPNEVRIKTMTSQEEVLVLADQFDEGWHTKIDGNDAKISRANLIFRAVKVPAGIHEVIMNYYPTSFDLGLKISIASILLVGLSVLIAIKVSRF